MKYFIPYLAAHLFVIWEFNLMIRLAKRLSEIVPKSVVLQSFVIDKTTQNESSVLDKPRWDFQSLFVLASFQHGTNSKRVSEDR
jgi:hypothetical protein